nr:reverse transcriptase domain-containing protein [Tanacetum cinerariifolium]
MRTRSRSRHKIAEPLRIEFPSQEDQFQEDPPEVPMAYNRTMAQLLQAPTVGYEDAIVIPEIAATNFELKHGWINLVQNKQYFGHDKEDPHAHIRYFNKITSMMRVNQPLAYQAPTYQAPIPQTQSVSQTDFERYIKANDAVLRNIQSHGQRSETLPGNTITNLKEDLKGITTRSGVAYQGPTNPTPSKVVKQGTEVTKDQVQTLISQSTAPVQPPVAQSETPVSEPVVAPIVRSGDPGRFLIPCEFPGIDECLALVDLGASINLMPLSVWKELSLPELTPTCMTLELADRSVSKPIGIAKDVSVKTGRALIDVHKGELTLRIENEAITYNLDQTLRYSANYDQMTANKIDVTDEAYEEYSQEVLGFFYFTASGSPTPSDDLIVSTTSPTLTPFRDSDFLLFEEADAFLGLEDDPDSPKFDPSYYDPEGEILMLEAILNSDPSPSLPNHEQSVPSFKNELKACEGKTIKSFVDEPPEVELEDLPPHLE